MAFSFEPFLAISAGHFMAVSAGPEQGRYYQIFPMYVRKKKLLKSGPLGNLISGREWDQKKT